MDGLNFNYLTVDEQDKIDEAFITEGIVYDAMRRQSLLRGINQLFVVQFMPIVGADPRTQLISDLMRLSKTKRLNDNSIPLLQWLKNTANMFKILPEGVFF